MKTMRKWAAVLLALALMSLCGPAWASVAEGDELTWNGSVFRVAQVLEGDAVEAENAAAEGRLIEISFDAGLKIRYGEISDFAGQVTLEDKSGRSYAFVSMSGTLGESVSMEQLAAARLSHVALRFDVPEEIPLNELVLCVNGEPVSGGGDDAGIPENLVGDWSGAGEPVGGGSAIMLHATVRADGTGEYTFEQGEYTESYPMTLSGADSRFTAEVPADNELHIVRCEGTYAFLDGILTLEITTTFAGGRTFRYAACCQRTSPDGTPEGGEESAPPAQDEADEPLSFSLGGIRYTITKLEDEPAFQMPNRMDGREGHAVTFSYAESGETAEAANGQLYAGARLLQPNGDSVCAYANMDNAGNPYVLYFGLSNDVLLADCVLTLESDDGQVAVPLSFASEAGAGGTDTTAPPAGLTGEPETPRASADAVESRISETLRQCAEEASDEWQRAIYLAGVRELQSETAEGKTVCTFLLRSFDPNLKQLGKWGAETRDGYWQNVLANARRYALKVSLTLEDDAFSPRSVKTLQSAVKKAASSAQKAFKDQRIENAVVYELFYNAFDGKAKKAEDIVVPTDDLAAWWTRRADQLGGLSARQCTAFLIGQTRQSLDVSAGPFAIRLSGAAIDFALLTESAGADALDALKAMDRDSRVTNDQVEYQYQLALARGALAMKAKGKDAYAISLNVDGDPFYGPEYAALLEKYAYEDRLAALENEAALLPDYAAVAFPDSGWLSGSRSGTQVRINAPKDSDAYYIQLRDYSSDEMVVSGFVRPGKTCTLRVPEGDYYFVMASGDTWYGEAHLFGGQTSYNKTGLFEVLGGNYYHTVTLQATQDGNMPLYSADENDLR